MARAAIHGTGRMSAVRVLRPFRASDVAPRPWIGVLGIVALIGIWQVAGYVVADSLTLASPYDVLRRFVEMLTQPFAGTTLGGHLLSSLGKFLAGFLVAVAIGIPLGIMMSWYSTLDAIVTPLFNLFRFIAPIAWVPFIFSGAFAPCVMGSYGGGRMTDPRLLEAARTLGAGNLRIIAQVVLPSAVPSIVSALRVAAGNGWQSLVGAELIVASSGIAYTMVRGQMNRTITVVMVGMLAIALVGLAMEWLFRRLEVAASRRYGTRIA